jgi:hypothetical protein
VGREAAVVCGGGVSVTEEEGVGGGRRGVGVGGWVLFATTGVMEGEGTAGAHGMEQSLCGFPPGGGCSSTPKEQELVAGHGFAIINVLCVLVIKSSRRYFSEVKCI